MKHTITIFALFVLSSTQAQENIDTIFYDASWSKTDIKENIKYYRLATKTEKGFEIVDYYVNGGVHSTGSMSTLDSNFRIGNFKFFNKKGTLESEGNYHQNLKDGLWKTYHDDGKIKWEMNFKEGKLEGKLFSYYSTGIKKREDNYKMDSLIAGECFSKEGENVDYYKFETMPEFPGGDDSLMRYLMYNVKYPSYALENDIQGTVLVRFVVLENGEVTAVEVAKSIDSSIDNEALRVVRLMPKWAPGKQDGEFVPVYFDVPVKFTLVD